MTKTIIILISLSLVIPAFAETIVLKSGNTIEGKMLERTDEYIKIDFEEAPLTYFMDEIDSIDGQKVGLTSKKVALTEQPLQVDRSEEKQEPTQRADLKQKLPFSKAIITYNCSGFKNGQEIAYIDTNQNKIAIKSSLTRSFGGVTKTEKQLTIYDGRTLYYVDLEDNEGAKMELVGDIISEVFPERKYLSYPVTKENFLDKECKVYQGPYGKAYFWNGILLKENTKHPFGDKFSQAKEAVNIQLDVDIPSGIFNLPANVKLRSMQEMATEIEDTMKKLQQRQEK